MDWVKIKEKHILHTGFTLAEIGCLVKAQLLTAHLERMPTEKELFSELPKHTLDTVQSKLGDQSTTLRQVLDKVLEDVRAVVDRRLANKARVKKHRENKEKIDVVTHYSNEPEKRREDKRREDNITPLPPTPVQYLLNQWRSKNRLEARNLKLSNMAEAEISAALNRGIKATEIEKIIWDTAGKGIKPWELFQRPSNKIQDPSVEAINKGLEIARKYAGGTPPSSEHEKRNSGHICGLIDDSGNELEGIL